MGELMTDSTDGKSTGGQGGTAVAEDPARGPMVRIEGLHRSYGTGAGAVHALRGISFDVPRGELVARSGPGSSPAASSSASPSPVRSPTGPRC